MHAGYISKQKIKGITQETRLPNRKHLYQFYKKLIKGENKIFHYEY